MASEALNSDAAGGAAPGADSVVIDLEAEIGFAAARALHAELSGLRAHPLVIFDAAKVESLSTAGVLVMVSFLNARAHLAPPAAVLSPSGPFVDAFSELGLFGSLMRMEFRT